MRDQTTKCLDKLVAAAKRRDAKRAVQARELLKPLVVRPEDALRPIRKQRYL